MDIVGPPCHAHEKGTFFLCIEYEKWQIMSAYYNSKRRWCFDSLVTTPFFFFFWVFHFDLLCHGPCAKFSPLNSLRKFKRFTGLLCPNFLIILMWLIEWWEKKKVLTEVLNWACKQALLVPHHWPQLTHVVSCSWCRSVLLLPLHQSQFVTWASCGQWCGTKIFPYELMYYQS